MADLVYAQNRAITYQTNHYVQFSTSSSGSYSVKSGSSMLSYLPASYWLTVAMWSLVGIALAAVAGHLGASPHFRAGHARGE